MGAVPGPTSWGGAWGGSFPWGRWGHVPVRPRSPAGENPLEFLREQPQFQNMRQVIQQNPALLPALLQQLGQENPQLLQVPSNPGIPPGTPWDAQTQPPPPPPQQISQHQEQFIQMLNEPLGELGDLEGEMGAIGDESPQMNYIQVTPQEKEAIERVRARGCWLLAIGRVQGELLPVNREQG